MRLSIPLLMVALASGAESPNRQWEEQYDKLKIRHSRRMVTDRSADFLKIPAYAYPGVKPDFDVAEEPPSIDFAIIQVEPEYLTGGIYGGWGECTLGPDAKFYFVTGNHKSYGGATAFLSRYDPRSKTHENVLSSQKVCGWTDEQFGDGKIHGTPDVAPNGDMWMLTFYGPYPKYADWGKNYFGGSLIHHNIRSGKSECLGRPVADDSWPLHTWDWKRNRLYGVGEYGTVLGQGNKEFVWRGYNANDYGKVLVYDTKSRKVLHGDLAMVDGAPEHWFRRSLVLDRATGNLYGCQAGAPYHLLKYDPGADRFTRMQSTFRGPLNCATQRKDRQGVLWAADEMGNFYKLWPDQDKIEWLGMTWDKGESLHSLRLSPGERYVYYIAGANQVGQKNGFPLVQYDTRTGRKKVLAFLFDYFFEKYGYGMLCCYGIELSKDGSSVFAYINGTFVPERKMTRYGRPSIVHIHIPASERGE